MLNDPPESERIRRVGPARPQSVLLPVGHEVGLIGRGENRPDGKRNTVVLTDLSCSRQHAELRPDGAGGFLLVDAGSANGTFVDGRRIRSHPLREGERVAMGAHVLRLHQGQLLIEQVDAHVSFAAFDLVVHGRGDTMIGRQERVILDRVGFALPPNSFMAVLGPSGSGKSTLVKALARAVPMSAGRVLFEGIDVHSNYDELCRNIGYVPQEDIVHVALTPESALAYAAELRFPADVSAVDRETRVSDVLRSLGLDGHRTTPIGKLSGGQRKRVSVALELLTSPSVLLLDEPTSGLDPGYEKSVMQTLRGLADQGRTVIVVTHAMQSLALCDRVLVLARGGVPAFFGPPDDLLAYFRAVDFPDVFVALEDDSGRDWRAELEQSDTAARYLPWLGAAAPTSAGAAPARLVAAHAPRRPADQFGTLLRRYRDVMRSDRRNLVALGLQAPLIGIMLALISRRGLAVNANLPNNRSMLTVLSLVLAGTYLGASNAIREIVKELPILRRERAVGLSMGAYVASKAVLLAAVTALQALILVAFGTALANGPTRAVVLGFAPKLELTVVIALTGVAAMALGLLVSAVVDNADKALTALPVILLGMYLLSGGPSDPHNTPVVSQVSLVNSAKWGFSAAASSVDLLALNKCVDHLGPDAAQYERGVTVTGVALDASEVPPRVEWDDRCKALWDPAPTVWWASALALLTITSVALGLATLRLQAPLRGRAPA